MVSGDHTFDAAARHAWPGPAFILGGTPGCRVAPLPNDFVYTDRSPVQLLSLVFQAPFDMEI